MWITRPNAEIELVFDTLRLWHSPFWFVPADGVKTRQIAISGLKLITFTPYTFFPAPEVVLKLLASP